jgi:DNA-binding response OmpR family regulator
MSAPVPKKILVIDDDRVVQKTTQDFLQKNGYEVLVADDGAEGVSIARNKSPDLILLDLSFPLDPMSGPLSDGFEIVEWLRRMPESKTIPIIILSVTEPAKYKERLLGGEIAAFVQKPLDKKEVLAAIRVVLAGK